MIYDPGSLRRRDEMDLPEEIDPEERERHDDAQAAAWERKQERERTAREFTERALLK